MRNAQMNDALVKALDPQLARTAFKKIANHNSTTLEPQLLFAQLVEKIYQEDFTRTHIDGHKFIRATKGLLHYYRRFQSLSINESNNLLYYIQETTSLKICLSLSLLLVIFYKAHSHDLSGHPVMQQSRKITIFSEH